MAIFFSRTNNEPYDMITDINPSINNIIIDGVSGIDTLYEFNDIYLIIDNEQIKNIKINVENEDNNRTGLWISEIDNEGDPKQWVKEIIKNVDINNSKIIIPLKTKWAIINNIYLINEFISTSQLIVYSIENYFSEKSVILSF